MNEEKTDVSKKSFHFFCAKKMETQHRKSRRCVSCNNDGHRASFVSNLKSTKHLGKRNFVPLTLQMKLFKLKMLNKTIVTLNLWEKNQENFFFEKLIVKKDYSLSFHQKSPKSWIWC